MTGINQKVFPRAFYILETMRIIEELMEIWLNEVCDNQLSYISILCCASSVNCKWTSQLILLFMALPLA